MRATGAPDRVMRDAALHARAMGIAALLSAGAGLATLAVDGRGEAGGAFTGELSVYGTAHVVLALVLATVGVALLVARSREVVGILVGTVVLCAAQLAGSGIVAYRRWPLYAGCCSPEPVTLEQVRTLAVAMASACGVTALLGVVALVRVGSVRWRGVDLPVAVSFPAALLVAVAVPSLVVAGGWDDGRELLAWALMLSLPCAAGLVLAGLMPRLVGTTLAGAVACLAVVATIGSPFLTLGRPSGGATVLIVLAALAVAAAHVAKRARRVRRARRDPALGGTATHRARTSP